MDCGAVVGWVHRIEDDARACLSAVQFAMDTFYDYGPAGFAAEFQNEPLDEAFGVGRLTADACAARFNGRPWREVPAECVEVTMAVDVQGCSLWYVVVAWKADFTGYVIDYGVWPEQPRASFTLSDIVGSPHSLQAQYHVGSIQAGVQAGLEELVKSSLAREFPKSGGGGVMQISRLLVDSGAWKETIAAVKHRVGGVATVLCKGVGIKAGTRPMSMLKRKPGEKHFHFGYMPLTKGTREFPFALIDTNYWKSFVHNSLMTPPGEPGAMTIFGNSAERHALFAQHITSETWEETEGHGRKVQEWTLRPPKDRDNHWLDATVYAAFAAAMLGCRFGARPSAPRRAHREFEKVVESGFRPELG
jgi:phage terminase large subunit GpA-like protein